MDSKSSKGGLSPFVSSRERPGATTERKGVRHLVQQLAGRENNHHRRDKKILPAAAKNLEEVLSSALGRLPLPAPEASARSLRLLLTAPFRRLDAGAADLGTRLRGLRHRVVVSHSRAVCRLPGPVRNFLVPASLDLVQTIGSPPFVVPLDTVTYFVSSGYGYRGERHHNGIDLAAAEGTPIRAAAPGKVVFEGFDSGYGNFIEVEHEGGWRTLYAHTQANCKKLGETVRSREVIASVGTTGRSSGPHLHFEIRDPEYVPCNPAHFIFFNDRSALPEDEA